MVKLMASLSTAHVIDLGLSAGITRFISLDIAKDEIQATQRFDTVTLTISLLYGLALPILYPVIEFVLPYIFKDNFLIIANDLLPIALFSFWLSSISITYFDGLDGCQRMDLRTLLVLSGQIIYFLWRIF